MFRFALKNMAVKKVQCILIVLSIVISAGVAVLAFNISTQVEKGLTGNAGYYSAIVGPSGSQTQLAMNTMYFTDSPLGTIPFEVVSQLQQDPRVTKVVPFAMADSYNGFSVVGTSPLFLQTKEVSKGQMFADGNSMEVVVGATVASVCQLSIGDSIYTSHSATEQHKVPLVVVGILEQTGTVYDKTVFTQLKTIWDLHDHGHEEEEEHEETEEHHHQMHGMVCAVLVSTKNPADAMTLVNDYKNKVFVDDDGDSFPLQAIEPMAVVREVLQEANTTKYIVYVLSAVILIMNFLVIGIITFLNTFYSRKEIVLMRLIGISSSHINLMYLIQNGVIGLFAVGLAFLLTRVMIFLLSDYVSNMGVVLSAGTIYPMEFAIFGLVFAISVIPTAIWTWVMSKQDSVSGI